MKLREVEYKDWKMLLDWSNDKFTRMKSFNQSKISKNEHKVWLKKYLLDEKKWMYILHNNDVDLGVVRAELNSLNQYILSWTVSPDFRNMGYGTILVSKIIEKFNGTFIAKIKEDNIASIKIAERNGFKKNDNITYIYIKMTDLEIINEIQKVRSRNNINWMDILRLAFKHSPNEAREIVGRINSDDGEISKLLKQLSNNG